MCVWKRITYEGFPALHKMYDGMPYFWCEKNGVPCNSQIMSNVKKTTQMSCIESPEVPIKETAIESVHNEQQIYLHRQSLNSMDFIPKVIVD